MTINYHQVESILKTLPIGYYIKRDVKVQLTNENGSYYDMMNDEIYISYPMIEKVCVNINDVLENDVRCLLYHEVSHAFLTPKNLQVDNIINIFEDERIETILKNFYMNVDFKQFVKRVNNFHGQSPSNKDEAYYQIVRFRVGPQHFLDRVSDLIKRWSTIGKYDTFNYKNDVYRLYRDITQSYDVNPQDFQTQTSDLNSQADNVNSRENQQTVDENFDSSLADRFVDDNDKHDEFSKRQGEVLIEKSIGRFDNKDVSFEIDKILSSVKKMTKHNGSAINAYSGVFNPRSVVRDDYKFFVQQNRVGHVKQFSKLHLNLFVDCSGSFHQNDVAVNQLLKALIKFEKSNADFSFDLISCGHGQTIRTKQDRIQNSSGGTLITKDIFDQYKSMQFSGCHNINIILYDGDAVADIYGESHRAEAAKSFKAFDNKDCILIVDPENEQWVNEHCKNARVIITKQYVQQLHKNVLDSLQILVR